MLTAVGSSGHRPRRRVSWYSFRASPSSNSLCDLSVCDMACGARHEGQSLPPPSLPSLPSLHSGLTGHTAHSANGYSNGYANGYANGYTNGYADDNTVNGHADGSTVNGHASENTANGHAKPEMQDRQVMTDAYLLTPIESGGLGGLGLDLFVHERDSRELREPPQLQQGREEQPSKLSAVGAQSVAGALSHLSLSAVRAPSLKRVPETSPVSTVSPLPARRSSLIAPLSPIMPKPAEDITVTLWTRDGAASPASVPCETDSESEPDEEPAVTIFPRGSSRLSRAPSVVISEHNYDFAAREPSVSARSRFSTASGYSTAMSGYSTALTGYSTAYEDLPSPGSADSGGYGNYNLYGAMPVTTSYNQFAPPRSAVNYTAAGRQRPNSWHVSSTPSPSFPSSPVQPAHLVPAVPERDAKFLQPPDQYFVDDVQPVGPRPSVELDIKPGFRVEFDEARRGRPF